MQGGAVAVRDMLQTFARRATTLGALSARHVVFGPRHEEWALHYELFLAVFREAAQRGFGASLPEMRRNYDLLGLLERFRQRASFDPSEGVAGRWVRPLLQHAPLEGAVLYLHGGGYVIGSARSHRSILAALAVEADVEVLGLDYRRAPEHPCPAAIDDALAAYRQLLSRWPATRIALAGDSAGGGLTVAALVAIRDAGLPLPAAAILLSPWTDLGRTHPSTTADYITVERVSTWARWYAGELPLDDPQVSPVFAELAGLPPLLLLVGGGEVLLPDAELFAARARAAGVAVELHVEPGEVHVYPHFFSPRAGDAYRRMRRFLHEHFLRETLESVLPPPANEP